MDKYTHCVDMIAMTSKGSDTDIADICNYLLEALQQGKLEARGYRRQSSTAHEMTNSVFLSLDLVSIPVSFWKYAPTVDNSGTGSWADDDEKPDEWSNADWIAGEFSVVMWVFEPKLDHVYTAFHGVRLHTQQAMQIVSRFNQRLARSSSYKEDRPPSEAIVLEKIFQLRDRGMNRDEIAKNLRFESGFENCGNALVREIMKGHFRSGPKSRI